MTQPDELRLTRPWVDWTARQIHDPIRRLRYLRAVAPSPPPASRWKSPKTIGILTLLALGLVVAPLSMRMLGAANAETATLPPVQRVEVAARGMTGQEACLTCVAYVWPVER